MDIDRYNELKTKGKIQLSKKNEEIFIATKRYDIYTGMEIEPEEERLNISMFKVIKAELEKRLESINAILADCEKL